MGLIDPPLTPPRDWFYQPEPDDEQPLTVSDEGLVTGHVATWGRCHTGWPNACKTAPHSACAYAHYHKGELICEDGERVAVGAVTLGGDHAWRARSMQEAQQHHGDVSMTVADARVVDGEIGPWMSGALRTGIPDEAIRAFLAAAVSGHWFRVNGNQELAIVHCVNDGGFPVPRAILDPEKEPLALVACGALQCKCEDAAQIERLAIRMSGVSGMTARLIG